MAVVKRVSKTLTTYQARVKDSTGKWFPSSCYPDRRDAEKEEAQLFELKRTGVVVINQDARTTTLNEYWSVWKEDARSKVSAGWKTSQDQMFRDYLSPPIGSLLLKDIDSPAISKVFHRMTAMGRAPATQVQVYSLVNKMLSDAVEYYEILEKNPVKAKYHRPEVKVQERSFLEVDDAWKLLDSVRDDPMGPAVFLCLLAGFRISEAQALRWGRVDFENKRIIIAAAYNRKVRALQDHPKQGDWGSAPIVQELHDYLLPRRGAPRAFVAPYRDGGMLCHAYFSNWLKKACERAGVKRVTPHELRHTATGIWLATKKASEEDVRLLLNHKSTATTRRYIHQNKGSLAQVALHVVRPSFPNSFPTRETNSVQHDVAREA